MRIRTFKKIAGKTVLDIGAGDSDCVKILNEKEACGK